MPTTRHGSETPKRGALSPGRQKSDQKETNQNNRNDMQERKVLGTTETGQEVENVRSTRRSQTVLETIPVTPRRTRGSDLEPAQEKVPPASRRTTKHNEVKSVVRPMQSPSTRNSKRAAAESPKVVTAKKQKTVPIAPLTTRTRGAEATNDAENSVEAEGYLEAEKEKESEKSDTKTDNKSTVDTSKDIMKGSADENKDSKAKAERGLKSVTKVVATTGSLSGADVISPRRSSRAVVPNSRFKDMVDLGKKKSFIKTEVVKEISAPAPKRQRVDYTSINVQQHSEANEITEEVITEETKIDPLAQMNLMDDMLVLPHTSESTSETMSAETDAGDEASSSGSTGIEVIRYPSSKVIRYQADSEDIAGKGPEVIADSTEETEDKTVGEREEYSQGGNDDSINDIVKTQSNFLPEETTIPEPQVIVIPGETGVRKIIIPKDPYRARLEQAFEKKSGLKMMGPSIGKMKARKLIVTPTHQHVSKKEAHRAKMTDHKEKESAVGKNLSKSAVTSVIYPWMQKPGIRTGQIIHTPEKRQKFTVLPRTEETSVTSLEANPQCGEDSTELTGSYLGNDEGNLTSVSTGSVNAAKVPNVRVVYVKAKQKPAPSADAGVGKSKQESNDGSGDHGVLNEQMKKLKKIHEVDDSNIDNSEEKNREIVNIEHSDFEHTVQDIGEKETIEETKAVVLAEEVTSVPVEQTIANTLCQVIEYKQQPQTAIEYVLLDNKMVPIHKPFQLGHHSRGQTGKRIEAVHRVTPGRVEPGGQKEQAVVKKIPLSTAQSAISTVISQIEEGQIQPVHRNNHNKYTIASRQQEAPDEELNEEAKTDVQPPRVIHGYIDHCVRSTSPTQIVEISTEAFNKEIYGEEVTLDTVTGELIQGSLGTSQVEIIPIQTVVSISAAGNQSEKEIIDDQSRPGESDSQSMTKTTESVIVNTDNESEVIYTEIEDSAIGEVTEWTTEAPVVSSDGNLLISTTQAATEDGLVHIDGLDGTKIPENATVTVEKLASGGEIVIMKIKETAVSETLEKIKTSQINNNASSSNSGGRKTPSIVKATVIGKSPAELSKKYPTTMRIAPVKKLPEVKITPVRAYKKSESQSKDKVECSSEAVSKTTGTNTVDSEAEYEEMKDMDEEEEEGLAVEESGSDKSNPFQEYIVVRLPEGTEVKQLHPRPKREKTTTLGEDITMDEEGMYVCVDCGHKTESRGNWFKHRRKHLGIRPHACPKCSYRAATSSNLKRHMQIHDDVRNFLCVYCNMLFRQKIHLERHLKYKHEEKNVQCPLCDYVCSSENPDLKNHIKRRHMPQEGALNAFTCDVCGLMTVSKKDLKQHKKFHKNGPELKLFCEHCSFVTDCVSRLRRHMLIHTKERPFQCGLCSYRATQKEHVLRHMRSQHGVEVERNQRRSLLEKNYSNPQEILVAGIDQSPTTSVREATEADIGPFEKSDYSSTDKIFACNYCSMKFAKLINLYKHLYAQHKQVMPDEGPNDFQCVVCDFRTNSKKNLLVHMRKHNMQDHSPPTHVYSCVLCRYINPRRRNLFQHMKKKHGIEIIMKDDGLNCYVTLDNAAAQVQGQNVKSSVMALSDIVTTQTMDDATQMEFITETGDESSAFQAEKITIDNIISDDMESYVVADSSQEQSMVSPQVSISSVLHASVQEHEAAEAIEGLQALAEQAGILETQNIDNDMTSEIVSSAIEIVSTNVMNEGEVLNTDDTMIKAGASSEEQSAETDEGFELSTEQLNQLATGDYVEINGEVYKVEIAPDGSS